MAIVTWFIGSVVFFYFLYHVILTAIDRTEMAKNIQEIKILLIEMNNNKSNE